jgi:hypothetical protein
MDVSQDRAVSRMPSGGSWWAGGMVGWDGLGWGTPSSIGAVGRIVLSESFQVVFTRAGWRVRRYDGIGNGVA